MLFSFAYFLRTILARAIWSRISCWTPTIGQFWFGAAPAWSSPRVGVAGHVIPHLFACGYRVNWTTEVHLSSTWRRRRQYQLPTGLNTTSICKGLIIHIYRRARIRKIRTALRVRPMGKPPYRPRDDNGEWPTEPNATSGFRRFGMETGEPHFLMRPADSGWPQWISDMQCISETACTSPVAYRSRVCDDWHQPPSVARTFICRS